jgi:hypothetical protein
VSGVCAGHGIEGYARPVKCVGTRVFHEVLIFLL